MKLLFALGNIGAEFMGTRHNAGFTVLEDLAADWRADWQTKDRFKAIMAETSREGEKVLLAKPTTFYNLAGESARAILDFYKLESADVLVLHDDLDLPVGTIRTRIGGSDGGSNGLKSLIAHIGPGFARLRIGVAGEHRATTEAANYVLGRFNQAESELMQQAMPTIKKLAAQFVAGEFSHTTNKF